MDLVRSQGVRPGRCIHTHPIKRDSDIRYALEFGCTVFVYDNPLELEKFLPYKDEVKLLLRVSFPNPETKVDLSKKFGCTPEQALPLLQLALALDGNLSEQGDWRGRIASGRIQSGGQDWRLQQPATLNYLASGQLDVKPLITHRFAFEDAPKAYEALTADKTGLGMLLQYTSPARERMVRQVTLKLGATFAAQRPVMGFIGAGNYASRILIPAFKKASSQLHTIVTSGGINGVIHGEKTGFAVPFCVGDVTKA